MIEALHLIFSGDFWGQVSIECFRSLTKVWTLDTLSCRWHSSQRCFWRPGERPDPWWSMIALGDVSVMLMSSAECDWGAFKAAVTKNQTRSQKGKSGSFCKFPCNDWCWSIKSWVMFCIYLSEQDYDVRQRPSWPSMTQDCVLNCSAGPWRKDFLFRTSPVDMTVELWMLHVYNWMEPVKYCNISVRNIVEYCGISQESLSHQSSVPATTSGGAKTWHIFEDPSFFITHIQVATKWPDFLDGILVGAAQLLSQKKRNRDSFSPKLVTW